MRTAKANQSQPMPRPSGRTGATATANAPTEITIAMARKCWSPAPISTPSSTNTHAASGCSAATHRSRNAGEVRHLPGRC